MHRKSFLHVLLLAVALMAGAAIGPPRIVEAQFIDRIVRPCTTGSVTLASVIVNPANSGNINVTPCTGGSLSVNGVVFPAPANVVTAAATLTLNQLVIGQGTKAVAVLGSLGTTTTVLHGNAAGAPSFSAIVGADCPTCVTSAAALTSTALMTGGGGQAAQTPSATSTLDASGNISTQGGVSTGVGGTVAGTLELIQGTAPTLGTTSAKIYAPAAVTSYGLVLPGSSATGFLLGTNAANINTLSFVGFTGTGNVMREGSPSTTGTLTTAAITASGTIQARNASATILNIGTVANAALVVDSGLFVTIAGGLKWGATQHLADATPAPIIASGFGASPSVVANNGTIAFTINVGTGGSASSGVVTMPTATAGWACTVTPNGAPQAAAIMYSAPTSTTSITITNYTIATGIALAWPSGAVISVICRAY